MHAGSLMSVRSEDIDGLILDIHAAPLDEARWPSILVTLRHLVQADQAVLFSVPQAQCETFWHVGSQTDPELTREYALEFAPEDTWGLAAKRLPSPLAGRVLMGEELIPRSEFLRTRFFNEFLRRYDIDRFLCAVLRDPPFPGANVGASLSLYRRCNSAAYGPQERAILSRLAPHLVLALNSYWTVRALSLRNAALTQTLDAVAAALFILDRSGRVVFENGAAQFALTAGECLRVVDGRLVPAQQVREQKACREMLQNLLAGRGGSLHLTIGPGAKTVVLSTAPLSDRGESFEPWGGAAGLVWLAPFTPSAGPLKRVATLFALTPAEERLLAPLSHGSALAEVADALQVSIHTARTQLKSIQRKTGWRTQGEIIRMMQQLSMIDAKQ